MRKRHPSRERRALTAVTQVFAAAAGLNYPRRLSEFMTVGVNSASIRWDFAAGPMFAIPSSMRRIFPLLLLLACEGQDARSPRGYLDAPGVRRAELEAALWLPSCTTAAVC